MKTIKCTWNPVSNVDGYNVYLRQGSGSYTKQNSEPLTVTELTIPDLPEDSYAGYATAVRDGQESPPSNVKNFTILSDVTEPTPDPEEGLSITNVTADTNDISIEYETTEIATVNKLEYTLDGGQNWTVGTIGSPLVINRGSFDPVSVRLRVNDTILSNQTTQARTYVAVQNSLRFTPPTIGTQTGCYNVHGVTDDTNLAPPSLNSEDWELLNNGDPIVNYLDTIGKRKIDPVGFYLTNDNLSLFYNSGWDDYTDYRGGTLGFDREATNQAGSLIAFNGSFGHQDFDTNPVLSFPQYTWQGRNRVNPYAIIWYPPHNCYYCWYGDFAENGDGDKYTGRRALGLAKSTDMINWIYVSVEEPAFDIKDVYDIIPSAFPNTSFNSQGRLYAFGATYVDGEIYLSVGGSIDGTNWSAILKSSSPTSGWSGINNPDMARPMPIKIGNDWYQARNTSAPSDSNMRAIAIRKYDSLTSEGVNHHIFETGFSSSAGVSRQLFAYNGKWHVAYRQDDGNGYRDMHITREK